jgi:hypothetical protein
MHVFWTAIRLSAGAFNFVFTKKNYETFLSYPYPAYHYPSGYSHIDTGTEGAEWGA